MKKLFLLSGLLLLIAFSCRKEPELPDVTNKGSIPTVTTMNTTSIKYNAAECGGNVINDGNWPVTARGICWSTANNLTLENSLGNVTNGNGVGSFTVTLSNLSEKTTYYFTAYATNERGTAYGEVESFTTLELKLPAVTTSSVTDITSASAQAGGNVTSDGNGTVSARGICWNTTGNPTLENSLGSTNDGTGTGTFTSSMTNLTSPQRYYVTAYATNEKGIAYGEIREFETETPCGELTVTYGGQVYNTVLIGEQCWFKENLNIGQRINGSQEQSDNGTIEKYCYEDNVSYCGTYGGLYQWDEMMQYTTTEGVQGICPEGWHLPTDGEWQVLVDFLGGDGVAGGKMKETGTTHWNSPNTGATNESGFTAFPGGYRSPSGYFYNLGGHGYFWSSSPDGATSAWFRLLLYDSGDVYRGSGYQGYGFSVRCLQD